MRLTQLIEAAAKFVELPPFHLPQRPRVKPYQRSRVKETITRDELATMILEVMDENTGVAWVLDPGYTWEKAFKEIRIDRILIDRIWGSYGVKREYALEFDNYDDAALYGALGDLYEQVGKITYQKVKSPTTGRDGWKFTLKPTQKEAKAKADKALVRTMKERAQLSRNR